MNVSDVEAAVVLQLGSLCGRAARRGGSPTFVHTMQCIDKFSIFFDFGSALREAQDIFKCGSRARRILLKKKKTLSTIEHLCIPTVHN